MVSIHPMEDKIIRHNDKHEADFDYKSSFTKYPLTSLVSEPNASRVFQQKVTNTSSQGGTKVMSNSADDILKGGKGGRKKDRTKRPQTINYVAQEAEQVFEAFCSKNKGKASSAPNSFSAKIDRNIDENKMKRLKEIINKSSDSEGEMERSQGMRERKKKSFFKRIKERIQALNKKEPLHLRSERERQRERDMKEREKEEKQKFTKKIFDSFRARRKPKNFKAGMSKKGSETNQSTDDPFSLSGHSLASEKSKSAKPKLGHKNGLSNDTNLPTPSSPSYPFSPSVLENAFPFIPTAIQATAEESRKRSNGTEINAPTPTPTNTPFLPAPQSSIRGYPYLAFFDSTHPTGSSVDRQRGLSKLEELSEIRYIDEENEDDYNYIRNGDRSSNEMHLGGDGVNGGSSSKSNAASMDVGASQSSVDTKHHRLSSISDSGCEDVVDKYTQVADLLDEISKEVNNEWKASHGSSSSLARDLALKNSYEHFQELLNNTLQHSNEPLLKQVALIFSLTRSAINVAGINSENASRIKGYLFRYYNSNFAMKVAYEGGLESLTEDSDT